MERAIRIKYCWNITDYSTLSFEMKKVLEEVAEERIYAMIKEKYTYGKLHYEDDNNSFSGSWSLSYINPLAN